MNVQHSQHDQKMTNNKRRRTLVAQKRGYI